MKGRVGKGKELPPIGESGSASARRDVMRERFYLQGQKQRGCSQITSDKVRVLHPLNRNYPYTPVRIRLALSETLILQRIVKLSILYHAVSWKSADCSWNLERLRIRVASVLGQHTSVLYPSPISIDFLRMEQQAAHSVLVGRYVALSILYTTHLRTCMH